MTTVNKRSSTSKAATAKNGVVTYREINTTAIIRIDRPDKLNALSAGVMEGVTSGLAKAEANSSIRAVAILGCERAFSAGADIGEQTDTSDIWQARKYQKDFLEWFHSLELFEKPIIAGVHGYCLGGGFEVALASDIIVATPEARFGLPEVRIGVVPGFAMVRLPQLVGRQKAKQLMFSGAMIDGREAHRLGIANELVEYPELEATVLSLCEAIARQAPLAVRFLKSIVNRDLSRQDLMWAWEAELQLFASEDSEEGRAAFREKRDPVFKGE